jgi:hypothetical protein
MFSLTLVLYLASAAVIGVVAAFAAHNRKTGWKKSRMTLAEAVDCFYADLGLAAESTPPSPVRLVHVSEIPAALDPGEFSFQLMNLRSALGDSAMQPTETAAPNRPELVSVRSR